MKGVNININWKNLSSKVFKGFFK
jgi:hypothetical protein